MTRQFLGILPTSPRSMAYGDDQKPAPLRVNVSGFCSPPGVIWISFHHLYITSPDSRRGIAGNLCRTRLVKWAPHGNVAQVFPYVRVASWVREVSPFFLGMETPVRQGSPPEYRTGLAPLKARFSLPHPRGQKVLPESTPHNALLRLPPILEPFPLPYCFVFQLLPPKDPPWPPVNLSLVRLFF